MENNESFTILRQNWSLFYDPSSNKEDNYKRDLFLKNFFKLENFNILNDALFKSNEPFLEWYSSSGLTEIITNNYISINTDVKINLLNNIQNFLVIILLLKI